MEKQNAQNPNGTWTIEQWASASTVRNGVVLDTGGPAKPDMGTFYETNGNQFRWWDHPGADTHLLDTYSQRAYFAVKVTNGIKACEIQFRMLTTFSNGNWSIRWGAGK